MDFSIDKTAIIHPFATVARGVEVGPFSVIGPYCILDKGVKVGSHCLLEHGVIVGADTVIRNHVELRDDTTIGALSYIDSKVCTSGDVEIGDKVTVRFASILARGCRFGTGAFIGPNVTFLNLDVNEKRQGGATVGAGSFIGGGVTVNHGVIIAEGVTIGAGAVVTKSCMEPGVYVGVPARRVGPR